MSIADITNQSQTLFPTESGHSFSMLFNPSLQPPPSVYKIKSISYLGQLLHCAGRKTDLEENQIVQVYTNQKQNQDENPEFLSPDPTMKAEEQLHSGTDWGYLNLTLRSPEALNKEQPCSSPQGFHSDPLVPAFGMRTEPRASMQIEDTPRPHPTFIDEPVFRLL